ncbi:hypothetical protein GF412_03870 [Candidatus Micrarchaeota archaeon]|nr:hypothetical protein [Candidatus Micrarchaeota archaeon]MBD3418087.1 hypothetical protein [Candidatus Micrarchaeota archaeon]
MGITRRQLLVGAAALGAAKLIPSGAIGEEDEFDPGKHVFVVGDLHLTNTDNPRGRAEMLVSSLEFLAGGKKGFHLIFNGDMLEFPNLAETCKNGGWQWEEFARLYLSLRELGFVPHLNFGNHDGSEHFAWEVLRGVISPEYIGNSSFVVGETKFILLSGIHPEKLDAGFLDSELESGKGKRLVVATHFPPDKLTWVRDKFGKKPGYNLWVKKEILETIVRARADVLCSHSHSSFAGIYSGCGLKEKIRVVGTPSVTYTLPYLRTDFRPPQVAGITVLDVRDFMKAKYFDGKKAFRPPHLRVESRKGTYRPRPLRVKR